MTTRQIGPALKHKDWVYGAIFNSDETRILTWSFDGTARIWNINTGRPIGPTLHHTEVIRGARFTTNEKRILTWSSYSTRIWDAKSGKQVAPEFMGKSVRGALFNTNETKILTWGYSSVRLWDTTIVRHSENPDIDIDLDFPRDKIKLQIMALTGTKFYPYNEEIEVINPEEWRKIKKEYMEFAREHYKRCKYPHANVFARLFPEEAMKIRNPNIEIQNKFK